MLLDLPPHVAVIDVVPALSAVTVPVVASTVATAVLLELKTHGTPWISTPPSFTAFAVMFDVSPTRGFEYVVVIWTDATVGGALESVHPATRMAPAMATLILSSERKVLITPHGNRVVEGCPRGSKVATTIRSTIFIAYRTKIGIRKADYRLCMPGGPDKLHFVIPGPIHEHNRSDIALPEFMFGKVAVEHYRIEFAKRHRPLIGYAVTKRRPNSFEPTSSTSSVRASVRRSLWSCCQLRVHSQRRRIRTL